MLLSIDWFGPHRISSELVDTFFIVVHKKPLIFLHWYHHITVLLYCYHSYVTTSPPGIFFVVMNYSVHATMYGYYFLMAMKMRPKWFNPIVITIFQISQMIVGVAVTLAGFYYYKTDPTCGIEKENNTAAFVMYGSYLFLFLQFFFGRYYGKKKPKKQKTVWSNTCSKNKKIQQKRGNPKSLLGISVIFVIWWWWFKTFAFIHHSFHSFIVH